MSKAKNAIPTISADEKNWRAQSDMDALIRANEIKADKPRYEAACKVAKEKAQEIQTIVKQTPAPTKPKGKESMDAFMSRREKVSK
jgi:hypothetical protein